MLRSRLLVGKYYFYQDNVCKIERLNNKENSVHILKLLDGKKEVLELDIAEIRLKPAFKIGEAAKLLDRKVDTIRKYERNGILRRPKTFMSGKIEVRFYSEKDIMDMAYVFATQKPIGRPVDERNFHWKIHRGNLNKTINLRKKKENE